MPNESEADVLAVEAVGAGKGRHAADGKIADPRRSDRRSVPVHDGLPLRTPV